MKDQRNLRGFTKNRKYNLEEENGKCYYIKYFYHLKFIESLYRLGTQATKLFGFVWNFATFARLPFGQFSAEKSQTWLGNFSFTCSRHFSLNVQNSYVINIRNSSQSSHIFYNGLCYINNKSYMYMLYLFIKYYQVYTIIVHVYTAVHVPSIDCWQSVFLLKFQQGDEKLKPKGEWDETLLVFLRTFTLVKIIFKINY